MQIETFDEFLSTEYSNDYSDLTPFAFRKDKSDKGTLLWLVEDFDNMIKASQARMNVYRRYHSLYKGVHWKSTDPRDFNRSDDDYGRRKPRMTVNFIHEMTETKVSQRSRHKIGLAVIPNNDEQDDINNSKACKLLLDSRSEDIDLDKKHQELDRILFNLGTGFLYVYWDEDDGDLHPAFKALQEKYPEGIPSSIKKQLKKGGVPQHIGDIGVKAIGPDKVFVQLGKKHWDDIDYLHMVEWIHIDELKADYPGKKEKIVESNRNDFQYDLVDYEMKKKFVQVKHFFHRKTKHSEGEYIKYTDDVILERGKLPYTHGKLPFIPDTDIDVYDEFWGRSYISNVEQMQRMYNNIQSSIARDYSIANVPKWMMPKGSAKVSALNNEFTIVEFTGPIAPQLVTNAPTNPQAFEAQDRLEKKISQHSTVYDISRGEVPPGVTANSALRFLDEQESQRDQTGVSKRKLRVIKTFKMMMQLMGQYYDASDDRTVRLLGKDNAYLIKSLKKADFSKTYDVKLQNSSALPDTKTGKISTIVDLNIATQTDPVFKKEEIIQMMDLGMDDSFTNEATVAVSAAKTVVELMLNREEAPEPQVYDNFLVHYDIFNRTIQSTTYRTSIDEETKAAFKQHILVMEGLMWDRAKKNKAFLMRLSELDMYPMFFSPPAGENLDMLLQSFIPAPPPTSQGPDTSKIQPKMEQAINREQGEGNV